MNVLSTWNTLSSYAFILTIGVFLGLCEHWFVFNLTIGVFRGLCWQFAAAYMCISSSWVNMQEHAKRMKI
jgi:hypothetical protein